MSNNSGRQAMSNKKIGTAEPHPIEEVAWQDVWLRRVLRLHRTSRQQLGSGAQEKPLHRKNLGESWTKVNPPDLQDAAVQNVLQQVAHRITEPLLYPAELRDHQTRCSTGVGLTHHFG